MLQEETRADGGLAKLAEKAVNKGTVEGGPSDEKAVAGRTLPGWGLLRFCKFFMDKAPHRDGAFVFPPKLHAYLWWIFSELADDLSLSMVCRHGAPHMI